MPLLDSTSSIFLFVHEDLLVYCSQFLVRIFVNSSRFTLLLNAKGYYLVIYDDSNGYWNTGGSVSDSATWLVNLLYIVYRTRSIVLEWRRHISFGFLANKFNWFRLHYSISVIKNCEITCHVYCYDAIYDNTWNPSNQATNYLEHKDNGLD